MSGQNSAEEPPPGDEECDSLDASVVVFMNPGYDRDLLVDTLDAQYSAESTVDVGRLDDEFDCCILDEAAFRRTVDVGASDPGSPSDPFLPFVLLLDDASDLDDCPSVWNHVDDVVALPVSKAELTTRIGNLIERRRSDQRTAERARTIERQNERLDEFASIVSHDLRNPLNVAEGHLSRVRERRPDEELDEVAWAHGRIRALIEDVLTVAREGSAATDLEPVSLRATFEECWRTVETDCATPVVETEATIRADGDRLRQLVTNLVRNAVDHAGPDVTVTVGDLDDGFYVADDGPGVPEAVRERVFETGFTTGEDGTGLGLGIVERIADAHDWTVSAASGDGGARFEITGVERA